LVTKLSKKLKGKRQKLKNRRVLITAGPTWVPIDKVRVISNIATGETGILLSEKLQRLGNKVTLVFGPAEVCCLNRKIRLIRFRFFEELKRIVTTELKSGRYDIVIHSAAVSDYKPQENYNRKVSSGIKLWKLDLVPTDKIIDLIKKIDPSLFLVGFKFEPTASNRVLIEKTKSLVRHADLDLAVANTIDKNKYRAYIINRDKILGVLKSRNVMADKLINLIGEDLCRG